MQKDFGFCSAKITLFEESILSGKEASFYFLLYQLRDNLILNMADNPFFQLFKIAFIISQIEKDIN